MKRSFVLFLAAALAVMLSAGIVCAQNLTNMSFTVPSGWTATEARSGVVTIANNSNSSESIMLQLGRMGTNTLRQIAVAYHSNFAGTTGTTQGSSGDYYFHSNTSAGVRMFHRFDDHNSDSKVPEGYYFWVCYVGGEPTAVMNVYFEQGIYSSLKFHPKTGGTPTPTGGVEKTFGRPEHLRKR